MWEGPIASRAMDHAPSGYLPRLHTHYLCVLHEKNDARSKSSGFVVIKRKWYLTIDGTSRTFVPEHKALMWLLSSDRESKVTIINLYECNLIRTINLG